MHFLVAREVLLDLFTSLQMQNKDSISVLTNCFENSVSSNNTA